MALFYSHNSLNNRIFYDWEDHSYIVCHYKSCMLFCFDDSQRWKIPFRTYKKYMSFSFLMLWRVICCLFPPKIFLDHWYWIYLIVLIFINFDHPLFVLLITLYFQTLRKQARVTFLNFLMFQWCSVQIAVVVEVASRLEIMHTPSNVMFLIDCQAAITAILMHILNVHTNARTELL